MNFKRNQDVKEALSIGGYSFETLRVGAILQVTKKFGLSQLEGKIWNWKECTVLCPQHYCMLITRIEACEDPKRKNIHFILMSSDGVMMGEDRIRLQKKEALSRWRTTGFLGNCSKRMFDYRLKIIKPGF